MASIAVGTGADSAANLNSVLTKTGQVGTNNIASWQSVQGWLKSYYSVNSNSVSDCQGIKKYD